MTMDDDRNARSQVTLRLDRDLLDRIDELARDEGIDRTELARRLLAEGLALRRGEVSIADYAAGRRSAWSAAQRAGIDLYEMLDRIADAGLPYRMDDEAVDRLRRAGNPPDPAGPPRSGPAAAPPPGASGDAHRDTIDALRTRYRPETVRLLFVGESSPANGTHFYLANSNLYRATREALGKGLAIAGPPDGTAFLEWFRGLGCWLVDLADRPVNRSAASERSSAVAAGMPALAAILRDVQPVRVLVVLRRIAGDVRRAVATAGLDDRIVDVLPFPTRQWQPVYVDQLAAIAAEVLGAAEQTRQVARTSTHPARSPAVAETSAGYGAAPLHDVMIELLGRRGDNWLRPSEIAREIGESDLWRRPSDGRHPPAQQISARARQYPDVFQTSDLGIRLRHP